MNTDGADKTDTNAPKQPPQKRRGWFRRNWRRFVLLLFVIILAGGGALYWNFFLRVYNLRVCREAMKTIAADKGMQETLGPPIKNAYWPSQETMPNARVENDEIDVRWSIVGSKEQMARAHLNARRRQGRWDILVLEVVPAGGKRVSIHQADNGEDLPPLYVAPGAKPEAPKTEEKKPDTKGPDINVSIPPGDAPAAGK
jgi:hypothetical protein